MRTAWRCAVLVLVLGGCEREDTVDADAPSSTTGSASTDPDPALLRELLGASVRVEDGLIEADGLLVRLAFEPLIRETGPVTLQLAQGQGYRITGLADGAPLWLLGLRDGDVLTHVDGQPILGREHELRGVFEARPNRVEITIQRGTEARTLRLRIATSPAWPGSSRSPNSSSDPRLDALRSTPRSTPSERTAVAEEFARHVHCVVGEPAGALGRCEIERSAITALLANPSALLTQARVVPSLRDGVTSGFKLYGIRRDTIPSLLGFANGDMITHVNGRVLNSPEAALDGYEALSEQSKLTILVLRRGEEQRLELEIVDALSGPAAAMPVPRGSDLRDPFAGR